MLNRSKLDAGSYSVGVLQLKFEDTIAEYMGPIAASDPADDRFFLSNGVWYNFSVMRNYVMGEYRSIEYTRDILIHNLLNQLQIGATVQAQEQVNEDLRQGNPGVSIYAFSYIPYGYN